MLFIVLFCFCFKEQEARTAFLRGRASGKQLKDGVSQDNTVVFVKDKPQHLNFFADIEEGVSDIAAHNITKVSYIALHGSASFE